MNPEAASGAGSWLHGIADPVRLGVLRGLAGVEQATAAELAARCQASLPTLRRHLDALVAVGLIEQEAGESDGRDDGAAGGAVQSQP
jgi:predicted ArsR family transcriptional regulator